MYTPLGIKTDYSILKSLIKVEDLILYAKNHNLKSLGILDDNLTGSYDFYTQCKKEDIKPIIGYRVILNELPIYLYAKNIDGLHNMFRISADEINMDNLKKYCEDIIGVVPFESLSLYEEIKNIFRITFVSFKNEDELSKVTDYKDKVFINEVNNLSINEAKYVNYLYMIEKNLKLGDIELKDYSLNTIQVLDYDTDHFTDLISVDFTDNNIYIPKYDKDKDSKEYLRSLSSKGLYKRLNGNVKTEYVSRLEYELDVIDKMGFNDYFLIVYDYIKYSIKNGIHLGPGRGSAVGSLVAYSLGITWIDPLKYDLLFERFLNIHRVSMPDIDIDFPDNRRDEVVSYVKGRYGEKKVAKILAFNTMKSREVIRLVAKINNVEEYILNILIKHIDSKKTLKENESREVKEILSKYSILSKVYEESKYLEGIKKYIGVHAAGVVISSVDLTDVIPVIKYGDEYLSGFPMEELEPLGLIKMDFLSIRNLTLIANILSDIEKYYNLKINLNEIDLDDKEVFELFKNGNTVGIFQFEAEGMKRFLMNLKPNNFVDLVNAIALYRPGPMEQIPEFIKRKNEYKRIDYIDDSLEPILKSTYGILIYQEQIMEILRVVGDFSYSEADIIRRAISKKKADVISSSREKFYENAKSKGYSEDKIDKIFNIIMKFADFGFNKSHSVAYALIAYQMAYLKVHYSKIFTTNLLNINIGSEEKTREYIEEATSNGVKFLKADINESIDIYKEEAEGIRIPLKCIKGLGSLIVDTIISKREDGYKDFFHFVASIYGTNVNKKSVTTLIEAGVFDSFGYNRRTLIKNLDSAFVYGELISNLDESLVSKPVMSIEEEFSEIDLMNFEKKLYGFYVSTHPSNKYPDCFKLYKINESFDKVVNSVVLVEKIKKIKTKNGDDMAFVDVSDDTGRTSLVMFKENILKLESIKEGMLVSISGRVEKRMDKYQIVVNDIKLK